MHKVRRSWWQNGSLKHEEHYFHHEHEALSFARKLENAIVKIYNELDELIHSWTHSHEHNTHEVDDCYA